MKSSRRKQTNPNRVSSGVLDPENLAGGAPIQGQPPLQPDMGPYPSEPEDAPSKPGLAQGEAMDVRVDLSRQKMTNGQNELDLPLNMHISIISCPHCAETFSNQTELLAHKVEVHGPEPKRPRSGDGGNDFPTEYHRLGRELQESTDTVIVNGQVESGPSPAQLEPPSPFLDYSSMKRHSSMLPSPKRQSSPLLNRESDDGPSPDLPPPMPHLKSNNNMNNGNNNIINNNNMNNINIMNNNNNNNHNNNNSINLKDGNGEPMNGKSERIFHMDAYCELCDREFCNKYFLKTHKANKHGIYDANSPPATSVPMPFPGMMMSPQDPVSPFNFKMDSMKPPQHNDPMMMPWSFKLDLSPQSARKPDSSGPLRPPGDSPLPMFPMPLPNLDSPKPSSLTLTKTTSSNNSNNNNNSNISGSSNNNNNSNNSNNNGNNPSNNNNNNNNNSNNSCFSINGLSSSASSTSILTSITNSVKAGPSVNTAPPVNDPSMEDYCHICQKHFCNKYYLKKHKQDVHGIAPENAPNSLNKRSRPSLLDMPMTSSNPMILPQPLVSLAGMPNLPGMPGLPNMPNMSSMPPGVMVINPYSLPPVAIIPAGSLMPGQQIPPPPHPIISQPLSITPLPDSVMMHPALPTPSSLANSNGMPQGHSPNKQSPQQEGGVHCNICSKEFCNEFYLQIHKESKHGIRKGSEDMSRDKALSLVKDGNRNDLGKSSPPPLASINRDGTMPPSRSPMNHHSNSDTSFMVCNLCNKEFDNKYLYRIHRIHDHGLNEMIDPSLSESGEIVDRDDAMRNLNHSVMRMAADSFTSNFGGVPNIKSHDNAVCDICNKEMTNQYFLRLHKFNVHGIDPSTNEKYERKPLSSPVPQSPKPKTPPSSGSLSITSHSQQPLNLAPHTPGKHHLLPFLPPKMDFKDLPPPFGEFGRDYKSLRDMPSFLTDTMNHEMFSRTQNPGHMDFNFFGLPSFGKLPEENMKLNFDPEAYCDICKKEFCSKYFLRTHKQNIHGIKCDISSSSNLKLSDSVSISDRMAPISPLRMSNNNNAKARENEKTSWRWKEPVNSSRVICDICNKEVCNKYFLRTHKLKKHGVQPSAQSPNVSVSGSPVASDCDTASNASSQPDEKLLRGEGMASLPQMIPLPPTEKVSEKFHSKPLTKGRDDMNQNNNNDVSGICGLCKRRFRNAKLLKEHIWKDHSMSEGMDMRVKNSPPIYPCQVCGIDFPAELSVQLHLIQEHNARVTLDQECSQMGSDQTNVSPGMRGSAGGSKTASGGGWLRGSPKRLSNNRKLRKYVCDRCDYDTVWLSSLLKHEQKEHNINTDLPPKFQCKHCHQLLSSANALSAHLVTSHGQTIEEALHSVKTSPPKTSPDYKCSVCSAVFPSRAWGPMHIRHVHIRSRRDILLKNSFEKQLHRCTLCNFKSHFFRRLQSHMKSEHNRRIFRPKVNRLKAERRCESNSPPLVSSVHNGPSNNIAIPPESPHHNVANSSYTSIAASLLSSSKGPEDRDRSHSPPDARQHEGMLLQSYSLSVGSGVPDVPPFRIPTQSSVASAGVGL